ncbi:hypothetical protein D3C76_1008760 [compost metagenome]
MFEIVTIPDLDTISALLPIDRTMEMNYIKLRNAIGSTLKHACLALKRIEISGVQVLLVKS